MTRPAPIITGIRWKFRAIFVALSFPFALGVGMAVARLATTPFDFSPGPLWGKGITAFLICCAVTLLGAIVFPFIAYWLGARLDRSEKIAK